MKRRYSDAFEPPAPMIPVRVRAPGAVDSSFGASSVWTDTRDARLEAPGHHAATAQSVDPLTALAVTFGFGVLASLSGPRQGDCATALAR